MQNEFPSVAHTVRRALQASGFLLPLGHVHQLLAACLGYRSLAAWKADPREAVALSEATHIVFDETLLRERGAQLGYGEPLLHAFENAAARALYQPGADLDVRRWSFERLDYLKLQLYRFMWTELPDDAGFVTEARRLGGSYADDDMSFAEPSVRLADAGRDWIWPVTGTVHLNDDAGDPMWTGVHYDAAVCFQKVGRMCLSHPTLRILNLRAVEVEELRAEPFVEDYSNTDSDS